MDFDVAAFMDAWDRRDAAACAAFMAEDGIWLYTEGEAPRGDEHRGRAAVESAAQAMFDALPDGRFAVRRATVVDERLALAEWTYSATTPAGAELVAWGIDVLTLEHGLIVVKDSYLKRIRAPR